MPRTYKHPPIEEALVEVQFAPGNGWDLTVPGALHAMLKSDYPGKPRQQHMLSTNLILTGDGSTTPQVSSTQGFGKVLFPSADGTRLIGVGPDLISAHMLRPYTDWAEFRGRTESAVKEYCRITNAASFTRIGVRYINRVTLNELNRPLNTYLACASPEIPGLPPKNTTFMHRDEFSYQDGVQLILTFAQLVSDSPSTSRSYLLDIDLVLQPSTPVSMSEAFRWIDDLRGRERDAFESLITPALREVFDAE